MLSRYEWLPCAHFCNNMNYQSGLTALFKYPLLCTIMSYSKIYSKVLSDIPCPSREPMLKTSPWIILTEPITRYIYVSCPPLLHPLCVSVKHSVKRTLLHLYIIYIHLFHTLLYWSSVHVEQIFNNEWSNWIDCTESLLSLDESAAYSSGAKLTGDWKHKSFAAELLVL